jgi:hypothetical protein
MRPVGPVDGNDGLAELAVMQDHTSAKRILVLSIQLVINEQVIYGDVYFGR